MNVHEFVLTDIDGNERALGDFSGQALLLVNVASRCGLTPQYTGLERLHTELAPRGFAVLGFPCNQFGRQEPGTEAEIKTFCATKYGVTFPMFAKVEVNGPGRHPLYEALCASTVGPDPAGDIKWNFGKFVVDKAGAVTARFDPSVEPESAEVRQAIDAALA